MKKRVVKKPSSKLLKYLGGKIITLTLKDTKALGGTPVIRGVLLDYDGLFYYIGENVEVQIVVPVNAVIILADGELAFNAEDEDKKPFGEKLQ